MFTSCVVLNESLLPDNVPPVSALNPTFVVSLSLGRELHKAQIIQEIKTTGGAVELQIAIDVTLADDSTMRAKFLEASTATDFCVYAYPLQALTGSYAAYANALKKTPFAEIIYLALGILRPNKSIEVVVNSRYADPSMIGLLHDISSLGLAMGRIHPDEAFSDDVRDADGNRHAYLTCIGHFFRKEKPTKLGKLVDATADRSDLCCLHIPNSDTSSEPKGPRMVAMWCPAETLKELKVHQMSGARMHDDLVAYRAALDTQHRGEGD